MINENLLLFNLVFGMICLKLFIELVSFRKNIDVLFLYIFLLYVMCILIGFICGNILVFLVKYVK